MKIQYDSAKARLVSIGAALLMACTIPVGCAGTADDPMASIGQEAVGAIAITGTIFDANGNGLPGVTVRLNGSKQASATTGAGGTYSFTGLGAGSYSVQPTLSGCTFVPSVINLNGLTASTIVNFDGSGSSCGGPSQNSGATSGSLTISGRVSDAAGNPVRGVKVFLNGNTQAVRTTTAAGSYSFQVNPGSYSLNPSGPCAFTPGVVNLNNLSASKTQNFTAGTGCAGTPSDAGTGDSGAPDTGTPDTGRPDTGTPDTGRPDTGTPDTGTPDTGRPDTGAPDTGTPDTGKPDTGTADTGAPDTCAPTTCAAAGRVCGPLANGCGGTLQCGNCTGRSTCDSSGQCVCVPLTACAGGQNCGTGPDGCGGILSCGTCTGTDTCGGGGVANQCGCTPATTCPAGQQCGTAPNGCGGTVTCATCQPGFTCNSANQCVCVPATTCPAGQQCGTAPNGCGGTIQCGTCPTGQSCNGTGQCTTVCQPTCSAGAQCGTQQQAGCPPVTCGTCTAPQTCNTSTNQCVCVPNTAAQACVGGQNCGIAPDGCGGTVSCGVCTAPNTCGSNNQCVCIPKTAAEACVGGQNCGTAPDGCGGPLSCGTCTAPQTCGGGGTPNVCGGCIPKTTCTPGHICGSEDNGCGGNITCGTCPTGTTCSADGAACNPVVAGCDINSNTRACLDSRDKGAGSCGQCAEDVGCLDPAFLGGTCELVTGTSPSSCGPILGTPGSASETQVCMRTLKDIFSTQCAASLQEIPCLCGPVETSGCLAGTIPAQGPVFSVYQCDLGATVPQIIPNFTVPRFGAGMANAIVQCLAQNGCDCF